MKVKNLVILLFSAILISFVACNQTAATQDGEQTEEEANANANEADGEGEGEGEGEADGEGDEKETRLSPLREANGLIGETKVQISYGSPAVKGRTVWGDLVSFGKVWRTGANEATTFETDKDVTINGQALPAGKYSFFTIPTEGDWTLVFNSVWEQWGAYDYDESKDVLRVSATPTKSEEMQERMEFLVNEGGEMVIAWENLRVPFTVAEAAN